MPHVRANGIDLAYVESGSGEPLILLHGSNADRTQFDVFRPLLGEGIRAIACDQRDSPDSPCEPVGYDVFDHARDAAAFIEALGLREAHVMGTSYGGIVAMTLAIAHPERVKSLILGATAPSTAQFNAPDMAALRSEGPEVVARFMLGTVVSPDAIDNDPDLIAETKAALKIRDEASLARRMAAVAQHDVRDRLAEIKAPTLILQGDEDPLVDADTAFWMAERIPGAEVHILEGSRHGLTFQHRQRTADFVRAFILSQV
ncbi:alpha/beta fold hydrolase [Kordiimonas pumila]|uniref:Alpha/beta fold hydrolase n=1 Tax=Kordiimonas pumila TaxID=2161677 RepID=A0ABV7D780_9PROT|nr:alpha/beta hydrolase [Kordiimonas pumila]